jgi:hypothetical protein
LELIINAFAIVEAGNEQDAKKKGTDLKVDCNISPVDSYGWIGFVVPLYHGDTDAEVVNVELYEYTSNINTLLQE